MRARVHQGRNSALLWRRYYVIAFVRQKNRASSQSDFSKIYEKGCDTIGVSYVFTLFREAFHYGGHASNASSNATFLAHVRSICTGIKVFAERERDI